MRSAPRRAARRDGNESAIINALRDAGYLVTEGGWLCDLIVCWDTLLRNIRAGKVVL